MTKLEKWDNLATNILKSELKRKAFSYDDLSTALAKINVKKTPNNLAVTINRGTFSFAFFLQCAEALDLEKLNIK